MSNSAIAIGCAARATVKNFFECLAHLPVSVRRIRIRETVAVVVALLLSAPATVWAQSGAVLQYQQVGSKLIGSGTSGGASQGLSVAISANGTTAIVGGPSDNAGNGAAWIYTWNGSVWTQQGTKIVPSDVIGQADVGVSVSISANGNMVLIGGPTDNNGIGAAWVYTRSGGVWTEQAKLIGTSSIETPNQGGAVALSADGSTAALGGSNDDEQFGAVWVFAQSAGVWSQQAKLIGTGSDGSPAQGNAVALSSNGSTLLSGGPFDLQEDEVQEGATWVFTRSGSTWTQQGSKLVGTGGAGFPNQGSSEALSADGNTAFIGGAGDEDGDGATWVFTRSGSTWTQFGSKLNGSGGTGGENQGFSVSISADGNTAIESGPFDNGAVGAAWVFTRGDSSFTQQGTKIVGSGAVGTSTEGWSVAISGDASTVILGGQDDNGGVGAAWIFNRNVNFGGIPITTSTTQTITIAFLSSLTLGNINVETGDFATPNFSLASSQPEGACTSDSAYVAGNTCTLTIQFLPNNVGQLLGSVLLYDTSNGLVAAIPMNGVGLAALPAFVSGEIVTVLPAQFELNFPVGVAFDDIGDFFVADTDNNLVREFTPQEETLISIAGNGTAGYSGNGGPGGSAEVNGPLNLALDGAGNVYFADQHNNVIRSVNLYTGIIETVAGNSTQGYSGDGGPATSAELYFPAGIAVDASGNLYISDTGNQVIRKVLASSGVISTIAGTAGVTGYTGDGGPASSAELHTPLGLTVDASGNIFIADDHNYAIRRIDGVTGIITTVAGNGTNGYTGDGGLATSAELSFPNGLTLDAADNIYIADTGNEAIRKVSASTGVITTIAGTPTFSGYSGDTGPATLALLNVPTSIALDPLGDFFFTDSANNVVRAVSAFAAPVSFGSVSVGEQSGEQDVTVTNDGNIPLTFTSIAATANFAITGPDTTCTSTTTLNPGDSCVLGILFAPFTGGALTGAVNLTGNSAPQQVALSGTGDPLSTTIAVTSSLNPSAVGESITFTSTITPMEPDVARRASRGAAQRAEQSRGRSVQHTEDDEDSPPAEMISFYDGTTLLGTETASNFAATFTTSSLTVGSHNITAVFPGNAAYLTSTSSIFVQVVTGNTTASTTTALTASPNPADLGASVTLTATVHPAPTGSSLGTVHFYDGETLLGPGNINSSGVATFAIDSLTAGAHSLTAVYSGNSAFASSTSSVITETIESSSAVTTATALTASPNPANTGDTVTLTAKVSPTPTGSPLGTVSFYNGSTLLGSVSLDATGDATFTTSDLPVGALSLTAVYSGNLGFAASTSPAVSEIVNTAYTVTAPPAPVTVPQGGSVNVTVTVPPLGGAFNSVVTLSASGLPPGATATFDPPTVTPGAKGAPTVMTIQLAPLSASMFGAEKKSTRGGRGLASLMFMFGLCAAGLTSKRNGKRHWRGSLLGLLILLGIAGVQIGCGGGFMGPTTTPPNSYVVTITGTSGSLHASTTVTVVVQ